MRNFFALVIGCFVAMVVTAQNGMLSKEQFSQKIQQSLQGSAAISFFDPNSVLYIDTLYHLPPPLYKAFYTTAEKDSFFFYYYAYKDFDTVLGTSVRTGWEREDIHFGNSLPMPDSSDQFFIIYFLPASYEEAKMEKLNRNVIAAFKVKELELKFESIKLEEVRDEPPPPPPPPPKPKNRKPVKMKNPA